MKATARLNGGVKHEVEFGRFRFPAGAPVSEQGGDGTPTPQELLAASLAACSAVTMHTYAKRKGWDIGDAVVEVDYEAAERGSPARCDVVVHLPENLPDEQRRRLMSVAAKSPVHRTLEGETMFDERLEIGVRAATAGADHPVSAPSGVNGLLRRFLPSRLARRAASL